jgi:hypothetical protein
MSRGYDKSMDTFPQGVDYGSAQETKVKNSF